MKKFAYEDVDASPVKSFFVSMLTRDIQLDEAILDLLDNCVDGILRAKGKQAGNKPYQGYKADIEFKEDSFMIADNCGGIPWDLHEYAFKMGRSADTSHDIAGSVGVYGIGMKRAIFKMGKHCLITTRNSNNEYEIEVTSDWILDEKDWKLPVKPTNKLAGTEGTVILIGELYPGIASQFSESARTFQSDLERMISTHYAFIIDKGFEVRINGNLVQPRPTKLIFDEVGIKKKGVSAVQPFIFRTKTPDGIEVFLAVGFTRRIPSENEVMGEQEEKRYSSLEAGWTVLCNDRAVLYCDRSELTGWGEAGVPRYHTQFIAISGIVEFRADDASKLPTTTTKRGIDASSTLYLQIKNKMREGMSQFTDYTNRWKGRTEESKRHFEAGKALSFEEIRQKSQNLTFNTTKRSPEGEQYKPLLPMPKILEPTKRKISFVRNVDEIRSVAYYLYNDPETDPSDVGEKCFDLILKDAKK